MKIIVYVTLLLGLVHCSSLRTQGDLSKNQAATNTPIVAYPEVGTSDVAPEIQSKPITIGSSTSVTKDLSDNESDYAALPVDFNQNVDKWITYFQGKGRKSMERHLARSTRYLPKMKEILRSHGLPEDLVYIALIESGFNPKAYSRARAVGYWQFMRGTGRSYNLQSNYYVDDRRDFIRSTEAASQYLKALYNLFGSWYLAMASYNAGENKMKSLVMKYYTRDFWELARRKKLPRETKEYIPKFLAARLIAKHPKKYGFNNINYAAPIDFQTVNYKKSVNLKTLAKQLGMNYSEMSALNPAYKRGIVPLRKGVAEVRVPSHLKQDRVLAALGRSSTKKAINVAYARDSKGYIKYRIRRGDTLSRISRKFGVSLSSILKFNSLSKRTTIRAGKTLRIPKSSRSVSSEKNRSSRYKKKLKKYIHVVRRGETLIYIANKYKVRMSKIIRANRLRSKERIMIGSRLVIPKSL